MTDWTTAGVVTETVIVDIPGIGLQGPPGPTGPAGANGAAGAPGAPGVIGTVVAGTGLSGGGSTSTVTVNLATPVSIANGGTSAATAPAALTALGAAPIASPVFTGDPQAPTPATADSDTSIATTAFVKAQAYAPLASPTFTGTPAAPTAAAGTSTTQLATTAFVRAGVTDGSNAAAGQVGEVITSTVLVGSAVAVTSNTPTNITSLSLTAGDWEVWGGVSNNYATAPSITQINCWINTVSATLPASPNGAQNWIPAATSLFTVPVGGTRINVASPITAYLSCTLTYTGGSGVTAFGIISARRMR